MKAIDNEIVLYLSLVSCIEVFYITWQEQGKEIAAERSKLIDGLMIIQEPVDSQLTKVVSEIKAMKTCHLPIVVLQDSQNSKRQLSFRKTQNMNKVRM